MPRSALLRRFWVSLRLGLFTGGIALALVAIGLAIQTNLFLRRAQATSGTVIEMQPMTNDDGVYYTPVFRYLGPDGKTYTITSTSGSNPPAFSVGEHVTVLYDRSDPADSKIDSTGQLWVLPIAFGIIGPIAALVGFFFLRKDWRRGKQARVAVT